MPDPTPHSTKSASPTPVARNAPLRTAVAWGCALAAAAGLVLFFVGRLASDRWAWSQYLHWLPALPVFAACLLATVASRVAWGRSARLRRVRRVLACGLALVTVWVAIVEWRLYHLFRPRLSPRASISIVHFNASGKPAPALPEGVTSLNPDLVIFTNLRDRDALPRVREALSTPESGASLVHADRFTVVSRYRIVEFGRVTLGFEGMIFLNTEMPELRDPGTAAWFRLDTTGLFGRDMIVWAIDLPSDPRLGRWDVMTKSMDAIQGWTLLSAIRQEGGNYTPGPEHPPGFPAADVIIGDFNTPGGSAAITEFGRRAGLVRDGNGATRRFVDSHAAAGLGPDGSFPGLIPRWLGWGIDHALVSDGFSVVERDVPAMGWSLHRAQRVIVGR